MSMTTTRAASDVSASIRRSSAITRPNVVVPADAPHAVYARAQKIARAHDARVTSTSSRELLARTARPPDLVVVGATRGGTFGFGRLLAERAHSALGAPVLQVRNAGPLRYRDVVIATDVESALGAMIAGARFVAPEVPAVFLHAYENPFESLLHLNGANSAALSFHRRQCADECRERVRDHMSRHAVASPLRLVHGAPRFVLSSIPRSTLLVMNRGRSRLKHLVFGSVTQWALEEGECDVLVV